MTVVLAFGLWAFLNTSQLASQQVQPNESFIPPIQPVLPTPPPLLVAPGGLKSVVAQGAVDSPIKSVVARGATKSIVASKVLNKPKAIPAPQDGSALPSSNLGSHSLKLPKPNQVPSRQVTEQTINDIEAIRRQLGGGVAGQLKELIEANPKLKASGEADFKAALNRLAGGNQEAKSKSPVPSGGNSKGSVVPPKEKMSRVWVAKNAMGLNAVIKSEDVKVENWPTRLVPEDAVTKFEDLQGKICSSPFFKGKPFVKNSISDTVSIPQGFKVVALRCDGDVSGLLSPGNSVDLIGLFEKSDRSNQLKKTSRTFLKNGQVFSVGSNDKGGIVGVLVNEKQADDIYFVQQHGEVKLVLTSNKGGSDEPPQSIEDIEGWLKQDLIVKDPEEALSMQLQLRNAARQLDSIAAEFESAGLYDEADQVRTQSKGFWAKARLLDADK